MKVDFVRFTATDGVELQGWYSDADGDVVVIHIHGMSGNGYENYFLDDLRQKYSDNNISFLTFDNRGRGIISSFRNKNGRKNGGSCFEIFEESAHDVQGAIDFTKSKGKSKFILQGHSLGGSKVVNYLLKTKEDGVIGAILLAPTDMVGWAKTDPEHENYLTKAHDLIKQGRPENLVGAQCWLDKTPLSAQTYPSICEEGTSVDIYSPGENGSLMSMVKVPMIIIYGDKDIGVGKVDGNIGAWKSRVSNAINKKTDIVIVPGANHGFTGRSNELAEAAVNFIKPLL